MIPVSAGYELYDTLFLTPVYYDTRRKLLALYVSVDTCSFSFPVLNCIIISVSLSS